jgi:tungstate transport system ATP-binding protein
MTAPLFHLRDVRKQYGDSFTLEVPALDIAATETLCLLGPTGAGKSTLLNLLANVAPISSGEVSFEGRSFASNGLPITVRRRLAMVFQRPLLLSGTVRSNIEYGLRMRGQLHANAHRVDYVLERLGLAPLARQSAGTLSGGQSHLVAMARALVLTPDVLLLDEPTAHLDPGHVALAESLITEEHRQRGMTVVWATHNLFQAKRVAQRVALLLAGKIIEIATTDQFFDSPADGRTADFVAGRMVY